MIRKCLAILSMLLFSFAMASEGIAGGKENVKQTVSRTHTSDERYNGLRYRRS